MIAVSVKDSDAVVDLLLQKGADINQTSECRKTIPGSLYSHETDILNRPCRPGS